MKNIQENIYRVKSLMNLLTEGSTNPKDWKVGEYYIQTRKGSNERNIIKITYKDETYISFDYVEYDEITKEKTKTGSEDKILVSQVPTQADGAIWEESNETVWNEISKSTPTPTTPTTPTPTTPTPTTSGDITIIVNGKDNDPYEYQKRNDKFFISKDSWNTETEVKDQNTINSIKEKYIPDTLSIDSNTTFNENILKYWKIFLRDYKSYITTEKLKFNDNAQITYAYVFTNKDGVSVEWDFFNNDLDVYSDDWKTPLIVDDKIVLQNPKFSDLLNPENPDRPDGEKEKINPKEEYIKFNVFSALADDIYRDLIEDKITNVSLRFVSTTEYNDNNELNKINFNIKIDGKLAELYISDKGVELYVDYVQVKPIWDDKVLKYRPFNANEKKTGNEWMKTQVELKLEHFKNRFKQLI